jgi:hypothetical protein
VAGISKTQIGELGRQNVTTTAELAVLPLPLPWKPERGAAQSYERIRKQARLQVAGRLAGKVIHEALTPVPGFGLARLPAPSAGDIFLDFEGDPFVDGGGLEFLFGYAFFDDAGVAQYRAHWALSRASEKQAFERFIDFAIDRLGTHPDLHIYHFAPYEPAALKRLMGRYASREDEIDRLLRSETFVDLYAVVRHAIRASVESYSIKKLEPLYDFQRKLPLADASKTLAKVQASVLDQTSRTLPTKFHYAAASLGAWAGGAANCQFFSYFATQPQLKNATQNIAYAQKIGYSAEQAFELANGGLIAIPATLMGPLAEAQGSLQFFGGISLNEYNAVNLPKRLWQLADSLAASLPGFLMDRHYRAPHTAMTLEGHAIYGQNVVLRDHYTDFYSSVSQARLVRCKHYCAPVIEVQSLQEMNRIVSCIPARGEGKLFFRGQSSLYLLERPSKIKQLLFGDSCSDEPSLPTTAGRKSFDYDSLHFALSYFVQERSFLIRAFRWRRETRFTSDGEVTLYRRFARLITR